jgi:hypothetical protein
MRSLLAVAVLAMVSFAHAQEFQTTNTDLKFEELMSTLNVNAPNITFEYKNTGTSVGMKIERDGKKIGKWRPINPQPMWKARWSHITSHAFWV